MSSKYITESSIKSAEVKAVNQKIKTSKPITKEEGEEMRKRLFKIEDK